MLAHVRDKDAAKEAPQLTRNMFRETWGTCFHAGGTEGHCFVTGRRTKTFAEFVAITDGTASHGHSISRIPALTPFPDLPGYRPEGGPGIPSFCRAAVLATVYS